MVGFVIDSVVDLAVAFVVASVVVLVVGFIVTSVVILAVVVGAVVCSIGDPVINVTICFSSVRSFVNRHVTATSFIFTYYVLIFRLLCNKSA